MGGAAASQVVCDVAQSRRRVVVVAGGGVHADAVRRQQITESLTEAVAHRFAIAATEITARAIACRHRRFCLVRDLSAICAAWRSGAVPVFLPLTLMAEDRCMAQDWSATSDALAVRLAEMLGNLHRTNRPAVALLKSCAVARSAPLAHVRDAGIVDAWSVRIAARSGVAVAVLGPTEHRRRRSLLAIDANRAAC